MEKYGQDAYKSKKINKLFFLIPIGIFAVVLTTLIAVKNHSKPTTVSSGNTDASLTENVSLANIPETTLSTLANVVSIDSFANESKRVIESIAGTTARMTNPVTTESIIQTAARATWVYPTIVPSRAVSTTKAAETRSVTREINTSSYSAIPPRTSSTTTRATWTYTTAPARAVYTTKAATTVFQPRETNPPTTQPKTNSTTAKAHTINLYFAAEKASDAENNRAKLSISYKIDSNYKLKDFVLHYHTSTDSTERWTIRMTDDCKEKYYSMESRNNEVTIIANPGDTVYLTFEAVDVDGIGVSKTAIVYL